MAIFGNKSNTIECHTPPVDVKGVDSVRGGVEIVYSH